MGGEDGSWMGTGRRGFKEARGHAAGSEEGLGYGKWKRKAIEAVSGCQGSRKKARHELPWNAHDVVQQHRH